MLTCKDCLLKNKCTDENKHFEVDEDGDSWARYCDDFLMLRKQMVVQKGKYKCVQGRMGGIFIIDKELKRWVMHAQTSKKFTKKELKEYLDDYIEELPMWEELNKKYIKEKENGE